MLIGILYTGMQEYVEADDEYRELDIFIYRYIFNI